MGNNEGVGHNWPWIKNCLVLRIKMTDNHMPWIKCSHYQQSSKICVLKPVAIKPSFSFFSSASFLMRSGLKCLFVYVCSWAFRDLCFYLPHLSASVDAFLFSGHAYVCGVWLSIEYLFAFRHPVMGFWVVFLIYCLLEQIEGDAVKCGHNFQWHNQE